MPKYEYKCTKCGQTFLLLYQLDGDEYSHGHPDLPGAEECEGRMKRVYSLGGIAFRGSGFYKNDN